MGDLYCSFVDSRSFNTFSLLNPCPSPSKLPLSSLPVTPSDHCRRRKRVSGLVMVSNSTPSTPSSPEVGLISHAEHSDGTFVFRFGDPSEIEQTIEMEETDEIVTGLNTETDEYQSSVKVLNQKLEKQVTIVDTEIEVGRDSSTEVVDLVRDVDAGLLTKDDETDERITADFLDLIDHGVKPNDAFLEDTEDIELSVYEEVTVDLSNSVSSESVDSVESIDTYDGRGIIDSDSNLVVDMIDYEDPNALSVEDSQETELPTTEEVPIERCDGSSSESSNVSSAEVTKPHDAEFIPDSERSGINLHSSEISTEKGKQELPGSASISQIDNNPVVPEGVLAHENLPLPTTPATDSVSEVVGSLTYEKSAKMESNIEVNHLAKGVENQTTESNMLDENDAIDEGNEIENAAVSDQVMGEPDLDEGVTHDSLEEFNQFIDTQESENLKEVYEGDHALQSDGEETVIYDQTEDFVQTLDLGEVEPEIADATEERYRALQSDGEETVIYDQTEDFVRAPDLGEVEPENADSTEEREEILAKGYFLSSAAALLSHPSKALTGGEDAYFIAAQNWLGVADGVGEWSLEGIISGNYAQELMDNCLKIVSDGNSTGATNPKDVLYQSAFEVKSRGLATVLVAYFDGQALQVANIGDTGFVVIRDGAIHKKSSPRFHELNFPYQMKSEGDALELAEEYAIDLEEGDVIVTATDGLFDNLYEQEIASVVSKSLKADFELKEIAETLAKIAQETGSSRTGRSPYADAIQAAGYPGVTGGKLDTVTVIVSLVRKESSSSDTE